MNRFVSEPNSFAAETKEAVIPKRVRHRPTESHSCKFLVLTKPRSALASLGAR
jgi:hypothetical protein